MSTKRLFIPISKVDAVKGIVYGVAASATPDRSGEVFDYSGSKPYFEKWSEAIHKATDGKSYGNLRSMHGSVAAGKLDAIAFNDADQQIEVAAKVVDQNELQKVIEGVYTGFSIGGKYITRKKDGDHTKYVADPYEISLVDLPCIPDATFEVVKAGGSELRKFATVAPEPTGEPTPPDNAAIAAKATELAKAAGSDNWLEFVEVAKKQLVAEALAPADGGEPVIKHTLEIATTAVADADAEDDDTGLDKGAVQKWTHEDLPGQTFAKRGDLRDALAKKRAADSVGSVLSPVTDALKALSGVLDVKDPAGAKKNSSDNPDKADEADPKAKGKGKDAVPPKPRDAKQKAKDETEKGEDAPMKSAGAVLSAAKDWLTKSVPSFSRRLAIVKAAGEFDVLSALPAEFLQIPEKPLAKAMTGDLAKSANLGTVSELIGLVASLEVFHTRLSTGDGYYYYSDATTKVEASPDVISRISTMVDDLGEAAATLLDEILAAMKAEDAEKGIAVGFAADEFRKVGARNSTADKNRLRKAHDLLAEIEPAMCEADKHLGSEDLEKALATRDEAFKSATGDILKVIQDMADRVKRIEAQPLPGRPSSVADFRVVEKGAPLLLPPTAGEGVALDEANRRAYAEMTGDALRLQGIATRNA